MARKPRLYIKGAAQNQLKSMGQTRLILIKWFRLDQSGHTWINLNVRYCPNKWGQSKRFSNMGF